MKLTEAKTILKRLGLPDTQQTPVCCYTLLALSNITPQSTWDAAGNAWLRNRDIMDFLTEHYNKCYAGGTRELIRKEALHKFRIAGLVEDNGLATNSPHYSYRITAEALIVLRAYGSENWEAAASNFEKSCISVKNAYALKRNLNKIPIMINGSGYKLSPGAHNVLQKHILEILTPQYIPNAKCLYCGDTMVKNFYKETAELKKLNVEIDMHSKLPDVILYRADLNRLYIVEAVTSTGPISSNRLLELEHMLKNLTCGVIFITAFDKLDTFKAFAKEIDCCSLIWVAEIPWFIYKPFGEEGI